MHGLVNRSIQCFVRDTYGPTAWAEVAEAVGLGIEGFESMLVYDDSLTVRMLEQAAEVLQKPVDIILEDLGTYLVSHPNTEAIRRLLRFGGETYTDFLHSLDDLPDRARLAVPDLEFPELELHGGDEGRYELRFRRGPDGFGLVLIGVLRALADDYGALVFLEQADGASGPERIQISVLDSAFAEGRSFSLAGPATPRSGALR